MEQAEEERAEGMLKAAALCRRIKQQYEEQAAQAGSGAEREVYQSSASVAAQCVQAIEGGVSAGMHRGPSARVQLEQLAAHLLKDHAGAVRRGESVVDAAIRLLNAKAS